MFRFRALPAEVQTMVFDNLYKDEWSTAVYAFVHRDWQDYFERKNFKSLAINQLAINDFKRIVTPRRQAFVEHLWFRVIFVGYFYDTTKVEEAPKVLWKADRTFTLGIQDLWDALLDWDERNKITLELSAFAPSDWTDFIPENTFDKDFLQYRHHKESGSREPYSFPDPLKDYIKNHKGFTGPGISSSNAGGMLRYWTALRRNLMGWEPIEFTSKKSWNEELYFKRDPITLPSVSVISKFLIRRTQFRQICPEALGQIFDSLKGIKDISIERWACMYAHEETKWCRKARATFAENLPVTLRTLSLSGERCHVFTSWTSSDIDRNSRLAKDIRYHSRHLEHLHLSGITDAEDFLDIFSHDESQNSLYEIPRWHDLETLVLTTEAFGYDTNDGNTDDDDADDNDADGNDISNDTRLKIENMLCAAARAARRMPRLREFEIRSIRDGECFFRFEIVAAVAEITWSGPILDSSEIMREWQRTAAWRDTTDVRANKFAIQYDHS
ncbi:hypothetical protein IL306_002400 [Fusarium sp. DS 682]|nr:hypothetical protein IL306_002400 [Fusarium sp. DS 682]